MAGHFFEVGGERDGRVEAGRYIVVSGNEKLPQISRWGKLLARQCCAYGLVQTAGTYLRPVGAHFSVICKKKENLEPADEGWVGEEQGEVREQIETDKSAGLSVVFIWKSVVARTCVQRAGIRKGCAGMYARRTHPFLTVIYTVH